MLQENIRKTLCFIAFFEENDECSVIFDYCHDISAQTQVFKLGFT
jgi:hypothetical protein